VKILYFAWLKTRTGVGEEVVDPPAHVKTVGDLIDWLKTRGDGYAQALADPSVVRVAVNQEYAKWGAAVEPNDEVALFPPVTGG
jgi:molybdopterin synthase sulfur carrier subunit